MAGLHTINRGGHRLYVDPTTEAKAPSVTTITGMVPKPFLSPWAAKLTAENAVDNLGSIVDLALHDRSGAVDYMKRAPQRFTKASADIGTEVHDTFENIARGHGAPRVRPEIKDYVGHIHDFHSHYDLTYHHIEDAIWSDEHDYAGSFDAVCDIDGETVVLDVKTTRSGVHDDVALQLSAYAYADRLIDQDGASRPLPDIAAGAVLHLRPEGWKLVPVRVDREVLSYFLHLRRVYDWVSDVSKTVIGQPDYSSLSSTGSQRRSSRT